MKISISNSALTWFRDEVGVNKGEMIKFYSQIYGTSPVQEGYALAFTKDNTPIHIAASTETEGIRFYVEETDIWFFNGHDLYVDYNEKKDEIEYTYTKA